MKAIVSLLLVFTATFAFAATPDEDASAIFLEAYFAWTQAEKFEKTKSREEAIEKWREADKLLKLIREKHPNWKRPIVKFRIEQGAEALKRLAVESVTNKAK